VAATAEPAIANKANELKDLPNAFATAAASPARDEKLARVKWEDAVLFMVFCGFLLMGRKRRETFTAARLYHRNCHENGENVIFTQEIYAKSL
jgi:hypothetical protein